MPYEVCPDLVKRGGYRRTDENGREWQMFVTPPAFPELPEDERLIAVIVYLGLGEENEARTAVKELFASGKHEEFKRHRTAGRLDEYEYQLAKWLKGRLRAVFC